MNPFLFMLIAIFLSATHGTTAKIPASSNVQTTGTLKSQLVRNFDSESTSTDFGFRFRNPRAIVNTFSDSEELTDDRDFYMFDENSDDDEAVEEFYEDEIEREDRNIAGTGIDEAVHTVHVLKKGDHDNIDKAIEMGVVKADLKIKADASAKHGVSPATHSHGHPISNERDNKAAQTHKKEIPLKSKMEKIKPKKDKNLSKETSAAKTSTGAKSGQIESLLSKLNTLIGDIETAETKGNTDISNVAKGIIPSKENDTGDCTAFNHERITTGFKGYVTYMSTRVLSSLPYMIDGDETFLLHHLDESNKKDNYKVSVEFSSKSCHCINAVNVKSIQLERRRHAILSKFTIEYNNGGWNYIHDDNGRIKIFSVNTGYDDLDHFVKLDLRIYARAFRIFPQDWKKIPWVRVNLIECS